MAMVAGIGYHDAWIMTIGEIMDLFQWRLEYDVKTHGLKLQAGGDD